MQTWSDYFELSKSTPPTPLLESALPLSSQRDLALDLGAGSLKDSKYMLSMGFKRVIAIDQDPAIKNYAQKIPRHQLTLQIKKLENIKRLPKQKFDLINAAYSLPFTAPPHLPNLIKQIINALKPGGIFCGQFFGPEDSWNHNKALPYQLSFTSKSTLLKLLSPLEIIEITEKQHDGKTIDGQSKHWHLFHIIAQRKPF